MSSLSDELNCSERLRLLPSHPAPPPSDCTPLGDTGWGVGFTEINEFNIKHIDCSVPGMNA